MMTREALYYNFVFYPLEVVSRCRDPQLQEDKNTYMSSIQIKIYGIFMVRTNAHFSFKGLKDEEKG